LQEAATTPILKKQRETLRNLRGESPWVVGGGKLRSPRRGTTQLRLGSLSAGEGPG